MSRVVTNASNLQVIYEDNHLIAVNKRVGDIVQGDKTNDPPLSEIIKVYIKKNTISQVQFFLVLFIGSIVLHQVLLFLQRHQKHFRV